MIEAYDKNGKMQYAEIHSNWKRNEKVFLSQQRQYFAFSKIVKITAKKYKQDIFFAGLASNS